MDGSSCIRAGVSGPGWNRALVAFSTYLVVAVFGGGCQVAPTVATHQLIKHQALIDFAGLRSAEVVDLVNVSIATPQDWETMPNRKTALYSHQQWRSPSHGNAVGVAYIHLPIPLPASAIVWFAKNEYAKQAPDHSGHVVGEWTDSLGRPWFEAENSKYHARGCVMVRGGDAWIVYCGYRKDMPPHPDELQLASRSMETAIPLDSKIRARVQQAQARSD
jgi:hypothetical protein